MPLHTIDLELTRAEVEVRQLEARLRVVPMNDTQLAQALQRALDQKRDRLARLRAIHGLDTGAGAGADAAASPERAAGR